jgi:hypothetical protein
MDKTTKKETIRMLENKIRKADEKGRYTRIVTSSAFLKDIVELIKQQDDFIEKYKQAIADILEWTVNLERDNKSLKKLAASDEYKRAYEQAENSRTTYYLNWNLAELEPEKVKEHEKLLIAERDELRAALDDAKSANFTIADLASRHYEEAKQLRAVVVQAQGLIVMIMASRKDDSGRPDFCYLPKIENRYLMAIFKEMERALRAGQQAESGEDAK